MQAGKNEQLLQGDYSKMQLSLNNNSKNSIYHELFDPNDMIDTYLLEHPKLNAQYQFSGMWKNEPAQKLLTGEKIMIMLN